MIKQKITPNLWFDGQAEEAAEYYISVFGEDSKINLVTRFSDEGQEIHGQEAGSVMTVEFTLRGQKFVGLNGGPIFKFSEAISFIIDCETQNEIDYFWDKLSDDPNAEQCGWVKDQFGVSWQIVPTILNKLIMDDDEEKVKRVIKTMLAMKKLDIQKLQDAYHGNS